MNKFEEFVESVSRALTMLALCLAFVWVGFGLIVCFAPEIKSLCQVVNLKISQITFIIMEAIG